MANADAAFDMACPDGMLLKSSVISNQ